ncbi:MAG: hypothetical protein GKR90_13680 [Pseudomonadales bacterium]|nr:hypothetical protein [Pseudomonadales bacterium]
MEVSIRLFGSLELMCDGNPIDIRGKKSQALLAWLALNQQRPGQRDHIANLLWPRSAAANARTSLRQELAAIRRLLPVEILQATGQTIGLSQDVSVDTQTFQTLGTSNDLDQITQAAELYKGDLLPDLHTNLETLEDWLLMERERFRRIARKIFDRLLDQALAAEDGQLATVACHALLRTDPLLESAHQQLIRLYAQSGQMSAALNQFDLCRDLLQRELSSPPSPETIALIQSLRDGTFSAPSHPTPAPPGESALDTGREPRDRGPKLPSIAVLPFTNMSSNPEHGFLADGMSEELINLLANCVNWRVTSRNTSFRYRDQAVDVREVGQQLGVAYVVEGSMRRVGERIRVSAQLVSTLDSTQIWSNRYDRPVDEIFDVQDEVIHAIFRTLKNRIGFAERERVRRTHKADLDAWGLLVKAGQIRVRDAATRDEQRDLAHEALSIDPDYSRAHAFLCWALFLSIARGFTSDAKSDMAAAKGHADKALATGATDPVTLKSCAGGYAAVGQSKEALRLAHRAFEISGTTDALYVAALMWNGQLTEAQEFCEALVVATVPGTPSAPSELRPVSLLANLYMLREEFDQALELAERDLTENPANYFSHVNLANLKGYLGQTEGAAEAWQKAKDMMPGLSLSLFESGYRMVFIDPKLAERFSAGLILAGVAD